MVQQLRKRILTSFHESNFIRTFAHCLFDSAFTEQAEWVAKVGGDERLPVGLFVGPGKGKRGGVGAGLREFLAEHGGGMPKKTRGGLDLRHDGGKSVLNHLRHVIFLIMDAALGEYRASCVYHSG